MGVKVPIPILQTPTPKGTGDCCDTLLLKMVMFHSYVSLPGGNIDPENQKKKKKKLIFQPLFGRVYVCLC